MEQQRLHQEDRVRRALERAQAEPKKKVGFFLTRIFSFISFINFKKMGILVAHPQSGYSSTSSRSNWNLEMLLFGWMEGNRNTRRKTLQSRGENQSQTPLHTASTPGIEPGPHWLEASALTTAPSLFYYLWFYGDKVRGSFLLF